ncbi:hypothetical protein D6779_09290 [Candidatus Parcubacteria bacterium]|nr:MAG: hypothetical protein D6779_09290 [Candidatus Parcubacteria bacterium]
MAGATEDSSSAKSNDYPCKYPEPVRFSQYETDGRNGEPIKCDGAYLIFNLAFEHAVVWENLKEEKYLQQFLKALGESWEIHPGIIKSENKRPFGAFPPSNDAILTEPVRDVLLGREVESSVDMKTYVKNRLDPDRDSQYVEPLLFSFKDSRWIPPDKRSKTFSVNVVAKKGRIRTEVAFFLDWIDLWLFPDGSGMLSFKVLLADESTGQEVNNGHIHQIDRMNALIRQLRDFKAETQTTFPDGSTGEFWTEVFDKILGFDS